MTSTMHRGAAQTRAAYLLSEDAVGVEVERVRQAGNMQMKVIHVVPVMTDTEREAAKKRVGNDLYEIFVRIQAELNLDNDISQK